jgi:hypothetical protein
MDLMPDNRALLGVDVVASASSPGYHRDRQWGALSAMLGTALASSGIRPDMVVHNEPTGDGALYTLPGHCLGIAVDLTERLDKLAAEHNRWYKPDLRLRVSIDVGAVGAEPGYHTPKIHLNRMLAAAQFRALVAECIRDNTDGAGNSSVHTGLIVSGAAFRAVFGGDYTSLVRQTDFAQLSVTSKEFSDTTWVRVPGLDAHTLARFAATAEATTSTRSNTADGSGMLINYVGGNMTGSVQARVIEGGVHFGREHL